MRIEFVFNGDSGALISQETTDKPSEKVISVVPHFATPTSPANLLTVLLYDEQGGDAGKHYLVLDGDTGKLRIVAAGGVIPAYLARQLKKAGVVAEGSDEG